MEKEIAVIESQTADEERLKQNSLSLKKFSESLEKSSIEFWTRGGCKREMKTAHGRFQ